MLFRSKSKEISFKRAVACFTYSYNGKEWGGYTPTDSTGQYNYVQQRANYYKKLRHNDTFMRTKFTVKDYRKLKPKESLVYCDPPYHGTTGYGKNEFDHTEFWDMMRKWSKNNIVFISEYKAPKDFKCVGFAKKHSTLSGSPERSVRKEKLFLHNSLYSILKDFL